MSDAVAEQRRLVVVLVQLTAARDTVPVPGRESLRDVIERCLNAWLGCLVKHLDTAGSWLRTCDLAVLVSPPPPYLSGQLLPMKSPPHWLAVTELAQQSDAVRVLIPVPNKPLRRKKDLCRAALQQWIEQYPHGHAPVVIHLADATAIAEDAQLLKNLATSHGPVRHIACCLILDGQQSSSDATSQHAQHGPAALEMLFKPTLFPPTTSAVVLSDEHQLRQAMAIISRGLFHVDFSDLLKTWGDRIPPKNVSVVDKNVQFTAYAPRSMVPETRYKLLAFAHLSDLAEDAADDEPDPIATMHQQAREDLGEQFDQYTPRTRDSQRAVPREGELIFRLELDGFRCEPRAQIILWEGTVQRVEFGITAFAAMDGKKCSGRLSVFLGDILLADISVPIAVSSHATTADSRPGCARTRHYRKIFVSYSHRDQSIVEQCERLATLGDEWLRDHVHLRTGQIWNEGLMQMIDEADVFQLFWSTNSMISNFVRQEWEYALSLGRESFVRPVYWEVPLPEQKQPELPPEPLRAVHFQLLEGVSRVMPETKEAQERPSPMLDSAVRSEFQRWLASPTECIAAMGLNDILVQAVTASMSAPIEERARLCNESIHRHDDLCVFMAGEGDEPCLTAPLWYTRVRSIPQQLRWDRRVSGQWRVNITIDGQSNDCTIDVTSNMAALPGVTWPTGVFIRWTATPFRGDESEIRGAFCILTDDEREQLCEAERVTVGTREGWEQWLDRAALLLKWELYEEALAKLQRLERLHAHMLDGLSRFLVERLRAVIYRRLSEKLSSQALWMDVPEGQWAADLSLAHLRKAWEAIGVPCESLHA